MKGPKMQTGTIKKWGNSLALRLPRHIAESARLSDGQTVELAIENEAIVVRAARKKFKLSELLADYRREPESEVDWGKPEGNEAW